jgi:hypothetical protein
MTYVIGILTYPVLWLMLGLPRPEPLWLTIPLLLLWPLVIIGVLIAGIVLPIWLMFVTDKPKE